MKSFFSLVAALTLLTSSVCSARANPASRDIPHPLPSHPGNIFFAGERVTVSAPPGSGETWRALDYEGKTVGEGRFVGGRANLGQLPVGYYALVRGEQDFETNRVSVGVLEPLGAPTPETSPIGIDVAMAWFFPKPQMAAPANLCALAGINWVRDRLLWPELEPKRGEFVADTRYDASIATQVAAGLKVLEVNHASAPWANPNTKRFPLDLRDLYNFYREMARRWRGQVLAFEPWNEADIAMFGGHTGSEMASLQKAAYFALKAGNPNVIACQNVFAIHRASTLSNFQANEAWPYFDTFNLHHYEPLNHYPQLYADFRRVSGGRPLWVTECSVHVRWQGDERLKELSPEDLKLQSERVTKTYTLALYQGAKAVFYFMLPDYTEGKLQYGVLHRDLTPRPAYLAVAAVGRLLADAEALGRTELKDRVGQAYWFSAKPDGEPADVLVVWAQHQATLELAAPPRACFDHLGRPQPVTGKSLEVGRAPLYAVLPPGAHPRLIAPPQPAKVLPGKPMPVVLQALLPEQDAVLEKSAYKLPPGKPKTVPIFAYNFGQQTLHGQLNVTAPEHWSIKFPKEIEIAPGDRKELKLILSGPGGTVWTEQDIRLTADFKAAGRAVLALRFVPAAD